jgi:3-dehydroquinate synthase
MSQSRTVPVELCDRSYDIRIGAGLLGELGQTLAALHPSGQVVVISDSTVAALHGPAAMASLTAADRNAWLATPMAAGEQNKTLATASALLDELLGHEPAIDRGSVVVALGGGVPGDVAGFVAAVTLRGIAVLQVPTTLLACVDSSVGGKTGVDHPVGKNLIGAFHQPRGVVIDVETLRTLPLAQLRNGLAECVKHAVIRDAALLDFIEAHADTLQAGQDGQLQFPADVMIELIARNVAIKAAVVADDEREAGCRAHLNFGHTLGHAIEAEAGFGQLGHGQAVSLGMVAANHIAVSRGLLDAALADRITALLNRLALPTRRADLDAKALLARMRHDKKARAGKVRFVLADALGSVAIYDDVSDDEARAAIAALAQ